MASDNNALAQRVATQMLSPVVQQFRQVMLGIYQAQKKTLISSLGSEAKAKSLMASVILYADKNPKLVECTPQSLWECIASSVQSGFWPVGFPPMAYYIPFNDFKNKKVVATFIPHYNAYVTRMFESGCVRKINCKVVRENDHFIHHEGSDERIEFKSLRTGDRGRRIAVFCITVNQWGSEQITVLYKEDVDGIKSKSRAAESGPWASKVPLEVDWMWMKSAIRQHRKLLPAMKPMRDDEEEFQESKKGIGLAEANPFEDAENIVATSLPVAAQAIVTGDEPIDIGIDEETGEVTEKSAPNV
jgi:recombination protein RecT